MVDFGLLRGVGWSRLVCLFSSGMFGFGLPYACRDWFCLGLCGLLFWGNVDSGVLGLVEGGLQHDVVTLLWFRWGSISYCAL